MSDFLMPALGADMEAGTVVQWLVKPGDQVRRGDVVAIVETHKGAIDVEIFLDGVIEDLAPLGTAMPIGARLARVREPDAAALPPVPAGPRAKASPAARGRAQALGVDLDRLQGTGPEGAVTLADVERAAGAPVAASPAAVPAAAPRRFDPSSMRRAIAVAMARSKREIPHYYLTTMIDCSAAIAWLGACNRDRAPADRLLAGALLLKAAALALRELPQLNGFYENDAFRPGAGIHTGWAIALRGGGLVAPAIHDADRASLPALMGAMRDLVERARTGRLRSSEVTDPTVTVTSVGERGADSVLGVIYPPQVAIIGFGRIVQRPWVVDGRIEARPVLTASLAADHRASDGHAGGLLLAAIERALQDPQALAEGRA